MADRATLEAALIEADRKAQLGDAQAKADATVLADALADLNEAEANADLDEASFDYRGAGQTLMKGMLLGAQDELEGGIGALLDKMTGLGAEQAAILGEEEVSLGENFEGRRQDASDAQRAFAEANPGTALGLELAGGLMSPASAAIGTLAKGGSIAKTAGAAALEGGLYGFAENDGDFSERATAGVKFAGGGAVLGGTLAKAGQALKGRAERKALDEINAQATKLLDSVDDELVVQVGRAGEATEATWDEMLKELNTTNDEIRDALEKTGRPPLRIPRPGERTSEAGKRIEDIRKNGTRDTKTFTQRLTDKAKQLKGDYVDRPVRHLITPVSTTLRQASPRIFGRTRQMEHAILKQQQAAAARVHGLEGLRDAVSPETYHSISKNLMNGNFDAAKAMVPPAFKGRVNAAIDMLEEIATEQKKVGYALDTTTSYWPRRVRDLRGFREALSGEQRRALDQHFIDVAKRKGKKKLTKIEQSTEAAKWMRSRATKADATPGHMKSRTIPVVSDEMVQYYEDPVTALLGHVHRAYEDIEMKKFFNQSGAGKRLDQLLAKRADEGDDLVDAEMMAELHEAIGEVIQRENLTDDAAERVREVLSARFGGGRTGMNIALHNGKAVIAATKLGQLDSTVTQLGDLYSSFYVNGIMPTLKVLAGKGKHNVDDLGVNNIIAQDVRTGVTAPDKMADKILGFTGFKFMDRVGKNALIKSSENRLTSQLKSPKGIAKFKQKWGDVYTPEELDSLIAGFANGERNDMTALHLFHELSDIQPVTSLEMPAAYLNNPNARIMYTLKSFVIKQLDIARRAMWNDGTAAGRAAAAADLARFGTYFGLTTGLIEETKDMMKGQDFEPEDIPDNAIESLLDLANLNRYAVDNNLRRGDLLGWMWEFFAPPVPGMEPVVKSLDGMISEDYDKMRDEALGLTKDVPIAGRMIYGRTDIGQEKAEKVEDAQEDNSLFR